MSLIYTLFISLFYILATETTLLGNCDYWQSRPQKIQENSLLFHSWSIYSQFGEEGILDQVLKKLNINEGNFVEFSSFYDAYISNVRFLAERGWHGVFIEMITDDLKEVRKQNQYIVPLSPILCLEEILYFKDFSNLPQVHLIKEFPNFHKSSFDDVTNLLFPKKEIDVLSVDLGGLDDLVFERLENKPKIITIKAGLIWSPLLNTSIPLEISITGLNQPLALLTSHAQKQGYSPVCYTGNVIFIRNDLLDSFKEIEKDPITLWLDSWYYNADIRPAYIKWMKEIRASNVDICIFDSSCLPQ